TQRGQAVHEFWLSRYDNRFCEAGTGTAPVTFPAAVPHQRGTTAHITLRKQSPPREWSLQAWSRIRKDGTPKGTAVPVSAVLVPVSPRTGSTPQAWKLVLEPPASDTRHVYLAAEVWWADEEGCSLSAVDTGSQSAQWTYHLRLK
ncbi:MAG TPA: hypothetical protein VGW38_02165, partial [Chloroflexota bacterium]|nr:hypothetical protein [Chloroflexota bacterium]